jgi:hypothetical protein
MAHSEKRLNALRLALCGDQSAISNREPARRVGVRRTNREPARRVGVRRTNREPTRRVGVRRTNREPTRRVGVRRTNLKVSGVRKEKQRIQ